MKIENKIREFILKNLYYAEGSPLSDNDSFLQTGVVDSMGVMELVAFIQSEFGVNPAQHELVVENFDSVHRLAEFVRRKLTQTQPNPPREVAKPGAELKPGAGFESILNPG